VTKLAEGKRYFGGANQWEIDSDQAVNGLDVYVWSASGVRTSFVARNAVRPGVWSCVDIDLNQAVSGRLTVTLDGVGVASATGNFTSSPPYSALYLWGSSATTYFDDVSVKMT